MVKQSSDALSTHWRSSTTKIMGRWRLPLMTSCLKVSMVRARIASSLSTASRSVPSFTPKSCRRYGPDSPGSIPSSRKPTRIFPPLRWPEPAPLVAEPPHWPRRARGSYLEWNNLEPSLEERHGRLTDGSRSHLRGTRERVEDLHPGTLVLGIDCRAFSGVADKVLTHVD